MTTLDYVVLVAYFTAMAVIGFLCMLRIRHQEDFFLGGRSFGKLLQTFAAFGAGTGANDPVTLGRTTYTSGLSGIWGVLLWLFVTPFYWIFGVWYRRMRHLTTGDWFVERYESRALGAAYALFGLSFYVMYLSVGFSAVGKVCAPLMGQDTFSMPFLSSTPIPIEYVLVPIIAFVVVLYGVMGGLRAAYWTDLIQGVFIILLSIILIPFGLEALVEKFGDPASMGTLDGFRILHEQVPDEYFEIVQSPRGGEFPLHYIVAITFMNLIGIVVQPHFIATGGGSAKTESSARVGLVVGNFMKRLCTVGWALTGLIVLALLADNLEIAQDPDRVWGVAAVEILGPLKMGLVGLMLACLLAALMSSADCYMLVTSALIVRNMFVWLRGRPNERESLLLGRAVSLVLITGSAIVSLNFLDVFDQLKLSWEMPILFAAPFWVGMFWRRANTRAAWGTILFSALVFFLLPMILPALWPGLREEPRFAATNAITTTIVQRPAAPADVAKRKAAIATWESRRQALPEADALEPAALVAALGPRPREITVGDQFEDRFSTGGKPIYWRSGVEPVGDLQLREVSREQLPERSTTIIREVYDGPLRGEGLFQLDFLVYDLIGVELSGLSNAALETMRLPPRLIAPFLVMILLSFLTRRNRSENLDRFYVKMKTPTDPDPEIDRAELTLSYENPRRFDHRKLLPGSDLEFQRPTFGDVAGFVASFIGTLAIIALTVWVAKIGS